MSPNLLSPPIAQPSGSEDSDTASWTEADSRTILEELAQELAEVIRARRELSADALAFVLSLWIGAAEHHMQDLGLSHGELAALIASHCTRGEAKSLIEQIEFEDTGSAAVFIARFTAIGEFALAERHATHKTPVRSQ